MQPSMSYSFHHLSRYLSCRFSDVLLLGLVLAMSACSADSNPSNTQVSESDVAAEVQPQAQAEPSTTETTEEPPSPDFELMTLNGDSWRLADQGDRPKLIMFWATWCPYCKKIFPTVQEIHETYEPELEVAAISIRDKGDVQAYVDKRGLTMEILLNGDDVGNLYQVPGTPAILLLDGDNNVVFGTLDSDPENPELRNAVDYHMAQRAARADAAEEA